jgi:hypothetical protein
VTLAVLVLSLSSLPTAVPQPVPTPSRTLSLAAANLLKPMLARGELRLIGATTLTEYREHVEKDAAFERRFQQVRICVGGWVCCGVRFPVQKCVDGMLGHAKTASPGPPACLLLACREALAQHARPRP